jgi:hypothetical protein
MMKKFTFKNCKFQAGVLFEILQKNDENLYFNELWTAGYWKSCYILYSTSMFNEIGGSFFFSKVLTVIQGFVIFFSGLLAILLIGKFGTKTILVGGCFSLGMILLVLGASNHFYGFSPVFHSVLVFAYLVVFVISMGATFWTYLAEICVDKVFGFGVSLNIFSAIVISLLFPIGIHYFGVLIFFFAFSALSIFLAVYLSFDAVETKGLTKQEIFDKLTKS